MAATSNGGMRDAIAAQSAITFIDGEKGELRYAGYSISELATGFSYEQVAYLLWHGQLPTATQIEQQNDSFRRARTAHVGLLDKLREVAQAAHPLEVLRYVLCWDALGNPAAWDNDLEANRIKAVELVAWFPMIVAGFHRMRAGQPPAEPRPDLNSAANFLYMLRGREPEDVAVRTLDTSLILHADHELNASTFAARVTIATQSNLHSAIASALGTLAGPRHGGASERVIHMLQEIGSVERVEPWVKAQLAARQRIMGFGHAVYRTVDPRSRHLRGMAEQLLEGTAHENWVSILSRLEAVVLQERGLYPNVDLYAAVVNHELGITPAFYTSVFACSRVAGWTAHAIEQLDARMIRPAAEYVGPPPRRSLVGSAG